MSKNYFNRRYAIMFNKNRKTKKSLLISTYECLISHYNFIENNNNLYLYGKKDKTKKFIK